MASPMIAGRNRLVDDRAGADEADLGFDVVVGRIRSGERCSRSDCRRDGLGEGFL